MCPVVYLRIQRDQVSLELTDELLISVIFLSEVVVFLLNDVCHVLSKYISRHKQN